MDLLYLLLRGFETEQDATETHFVIIIQWRWCLRRQALTIQEGEIGTIIVFKQVLTILVEDMCMQTRDTTLFATMGGQVNVRIDVADSVLTTNCDIVFTTQVKFLVVRLYDQTSLQ